MLGQFKTLSKAFWLIYLAGYVTLASVMYFVLINSGPEHKILTLFLFLLYGTLFGASAILFVSRQLYSHLYFMAQTAILIGIINLHPPLTDVIGILFLPITSQAPLFLPLTPGFLWVLGYFSLSFLSDWQIHGFINIAGAVLSSGGFLGFGAFGATLRRSEQQRKEESTLHSELQAAYIQLEKMTKQAEHLAVAEERNRLAREMHDSLGHRLTVAVVQLEGAKRLIPIDPQRAATIVDSMRSQLKEALGELRRTLSSLRNTDGQVSEMVTLESAVTQLVHTFQNATGLPITFRIEPDLPELPPDHHQTIYRAVQESLTNIQRHANATQAWVDIHCQQQQLQLTTKDDGQGFTGQIEDGRFGLRGLEERAQQLGGCLEIKAIEPTGTELKLTLPFTKV